MNSRHQCLAVDAKKKLFSPETCDQKLPTLCFDKNNKPKSKSKAKKSTKKFVNSAALENEVCNFDSQCKVLTHNIFFHADASPV